MDQLWKKETKLDKRIIFMLIMYIAMAILAVITAFVTKNTTWFVVASLWICLAIDNYCSEKIKKGKDAIIRINEDYIKTQDRMILDLFKQIEKKYVLIPIDYIKIPEHFTEPKKWKMKERLNYYYKNKCFKTPIVINNENELVDGYTSYLIAKKNHMNMVRVEING